MASSVWASSFTSCRLAPATISESGAPRPSTSRLRLVPFFPPIGRVISHGLLRQRRFALCPVQALPFPSDSRQVVILRQPSAPQAHKESFLLPWLKVMVNGAGAAETLGERLPLTTGAEHIDDGGKNLARRNRLAPAARPTVILASGSQARIALRQKWFDARPERVGNFPRWSGRHGAIMGETQKQVNYLFTDKL